MTAHACDQLSESISVSMITVLQFHQRINPIPVNTPGCNVQTSIVDMKSALEVNS